MIKRIVHQSPTADFPNELLSAMGWFSYYPTAVSIAIQQQGQQSIRAKITHIVYKSIEHLPSEKMNLGGEMVETRYPAP